MKIDKPIIDIANMKNVTKVLIKSLLFFYGSILCITLSTIYFIMGEYLKAGLYSLAFVGMALMTIQFSSQYKMFKFLSQFRGNINDKKNKG